MLDLADICACVHIFCSFNFFVEINQWLACNSRCMYMVKKNYVALWFFFSPSCVHLFFFLRVLLFFLRVSCVQLLAFNRMDGRFRAMLQLDLLDLSLDWRMKDCCNS